MRNNAQILMLRALYDVFAEWATPFPFACRKGCTACCTQSVTMTTLEGRLISDFAALPSFRQDMAALLASCRILEPRKKRLTTNEFVKAYLAGDDAEEENDSARQFEPCMFLNQGACVIYPVRPFMCRCFASISCCAKQGSAEAPSSYLTASTVMMQIIEHMDENGAWGNMVDILKSGQSRENNTRLRLTRPIPGFYVAPEEREQVGELLRMLYGTQVQGRSFQALLHQLRG